MELALMPVMSARASLAVRRNHTAKPSKRGGRNGITAEEIKDVEELATPRTPVIYEVVRRLGEEEMERPVTSLWWSGVAAGLSISFSLLSQAILTAHLPEASWQPLVVSFGYCIGFIMAVLSRQQLFTESTITAVLPVAADVTWGNIVRMARLWAIVLAANLAGTLFAALFCTFTPVLPGDIYSGMLEISRDLLAFGWWEMVFRADCRGLSDGRHGLADAGRGRRAIPRHHADDVADRRRRIHPHRRRQHGILSSGVFGGVGLVANAHRIHGTGPDRQHDRRHRAVRADRLCPGDGRDLGP